MVAFGPQRGPNDERVVLAPFRTSDRKSTRLNSSHQAISYAVFCLEKRHHFAWQLSTDGHLLDQRARVLPVKPIEPQQADVGKTRPGRLELGPKGHEREYRQTPDPVDREIEQLKRRGIGPMHVLADNQHWLLPCQTLKLIEKGGECLSPLLHWIQAERRIALASFDR